MSLSKSFTAWFDEYVALVVGVPVLIGVVALLGYTIRGSLRENEADAACKKAAFPMVHEYRRGICYRYAENGDMIKVYGEGE